MKPSLDNYSLFYLLFSLCTPENGPPFAAFAFEDFQKLPQRHLARLPRVEHAHKGLGLVLHCGWLADEGRHTCHVLAAQARFFVPELPVASAQQFLRGVHVVLEFACFGGFFIKKKEGRRITIKCGTRAASNSYENNAPFRAACTQTCACACARAKRTQVVHARLLACTCCHHGGHRRRVFLLARPSFGRGFVDGRRWGRWQERERKARVCQDAAWEEENNNGNMSFQQQKQQ